MPGEEIGLRGRERGPHGRDRPREARPLARDAVEVALDEENGVLPADRLARAVEAVQELALREARRLGRVEVLGLLVAERARPAAEDLAQWNGLIRVQIYGETSDGDKRTARTRFYYGAPSAKLTGYYRDELVDGHLQLLAEIEVKELGEYRLEATLSGSHGLLTWSENTVQLEPGITMMPLTFWGLAFREANEPGPYKLSSIALANVTYKPPQLNDAFSTTYETAPYKPQDFSNERYNDPRLIERAARAEARARGETTAGQ